MKSFTAKTMDYEGVTLDLMLAKPDGSCCEHCFFKNIVVEACYTKRHGFDCKGGYWVKR